MLEMIGMAALGALKNARDSQKQNQRRQDEMLANAEMSRYDPLNQSSKIDVEDAGAQNGLSGALQGGMAGYQLSDNMETSQAARDSYAADKELKDAQVQALAQDSISRYKPQGKKKDSVFFNASDY